MQSTVHISLSSFSKKKHEVPKMMVGEDVQAMKCVRKSILKMIKLLPGRLQTAVDRKVRYTGNWNSVLMHWCSHRIWVLLRIFICNNCNPVWNCYFFHIFLQLSSTSLLAQSLGEVSMSLGLWGSLHCSPSVWGSGLSVSTNTQDVPIKSCLRGLWLNFKPFQTIPRSLELIWGNIPLLLDLSS